MAAAGIPVAALLVAHVPIHTGPRPAGWSEAPNERNPWRAGGDPD